MHPDSNGVSWKYYEEVYKDDVVQHPSNLRMIPRITPNHLNLTADESSPLYTGKYKYHLNKLSSINSKFYVLGHLNAYTNLVLLVLIAVIYRVDNRGFNIKVN